jgi:hypothetical protein
VPIGIAAVWLCLFALPKDEAVARGTRIDWTAIFLLALGL